MFKYVKSFQFFSGNFFFNFNSKFLDNFFFSKRKTYSNSSKKSIYYLVLINKFKHFSIERFIYTKYNFNEGHLIFSGYVEKDFITMKYYYDTPLLLI